MDGSNIQVKGCPKILKSGPRKGLECGKKLDRTYINDPESGKYCYTHSQSIRDAKAAENAKKRQAQWEKEQDRLKELRLERIANANVLDAKEIYLKTGAETGYFIDELIEEFRYLLETAQSTSCDCRCRCDWSYGY